MQYGIQAEEARRTDDQRDPLSPAGEEQMKEYRKWEKLDNSALLFPAIATETMTNTYRISCVLREEVRPELLQQALDLLLPKFPGFDVCLRTGVFWYYLERNNHPAPPVEEENTYPCGAIHPSRNRHYLFRVTYFRSRINLEVFHVLADGTGAIGFLRELVYQYLRLSHPGLREKLGDGLAPETSLNREDDFVRNYRRKHRKNYKMGRAFRIRGERLPKNGVGVTIGYMPLDRLKEVARTQYGLTVNEYLVAAFTWSTYQENARKVSRKHPIRVAVPVNLRPFFRSITTKNFFVVVSAEFAPVRDEYTFRDIARIVREDLARQITKENLEAVFSYNVSNQDIAAARFVPLPLKRLAIRLVYNKIALANTATITNIGRFEVGEDYRPYISMFSGLLPFSRGQEIKGVISSCGDTLALSFSSAFSERVIQRGVFRRLAADGIPVRVETNGVFYQ
ncbi:hypothetical protein [Eubacterium pyruvativorans]|uniref:hypothetical protein n=1 Tax=Eubacterium pyruvativorans TaxID=155865 RepID=UPI0023F14CAA|nr:hypothetical protein [Eubacterium pyruvativorans]